MMLAQTINYWELQETAAVQAGLAEAAELATLIITME